MSHAGSASGAIHGIDPIVVKDFVRSSQSDIRLCHPSLEAISIRLEAIASGWRPSLLETKKKPKEERSTVGCYQTLPPFFGGHLY